MEVQGGTVAAGRVWRRWVLANVAGEVIGFAAAMVLGVAAAPGIELVAASSGVLAGGLAVLAVLAAGGAEGTAVALAQWLALRRLLPGLSRRGWLAATVGGAVAAWGAGMAIGARMGQDGGTEPSWPLLVAGALVIGALAGTVLAGPQWLVLRRVLPRAGWWVPAHALAWAVGMLVAFGGTSFIDEQDSASRVAAVSGATGLAMGAAVAAITGVALVRLLAGAPAPAAAGRHAPGVYPAMAQPVGGR